LQCFRVSGKKRVQISKKRLLFIKERERDALLLASNNAHTLRKGEHTHAEREWYIHIHLLCRKKRKMSSSKDQQKQIEKALEKMRLENKSGGNESVDKQEIVKALSQLHGDGGLIGALQAKLDGLVGLSSGYVEELHPKIRARLFSLQVLQTERDELFEKYSEERRALEEKYEKLYAPLYQSRKDIVTGEKEYTDCEEELKKEIEALPADDKSPTGVPDFWLVAMKNIEDLAEEISERDEACLSALVDVQTGKLEGEDEDGDEMVGFYLRFYFKENAYFTNKCIEKRYHMEDDSEDAVLNYIVCDDIDWKPGKNLTVKVLRKKPKPGAKNQKPITKTEPCESFFTFFYPPEVPDEDEQENMTEEEVEELQEQMENDYAIGSLIATALVPNAVDHFLGLHLEDDEDEDEDDEEDDDAEYGESIDGDSDDDDDDSDDDDEDENGEKIKGLDPKAKEECKQQ
jgi:nucleosome assembly protein 1-like 1